MLAFSPSCIILKQQEISMVEKPLDFTRKYLRRMDEKLDRVLIRMDELSSSISGLLQIAAAQSSHLNRLDQRVERIEKRMNLVDA
jgi:hypothetical protein